MLPCSHYLDSVPLPALGRASAHSTQEPWQSSLQVSACARGSQHFRQSVGTAQFGTSTAHGPPFHRRPDTGTPRGHHTQQGQARGSSSRASV